MTNKLTPDEQNLIDEIMAKRNETIQNFKVDFSVDDIPDIDVERSEDIQPVSAEKTAQVIQEEKEENHNESSATQTIHYTKQIDFIDEDDEEEPKKKNPFIGCLFKLLSGLTILLVSGVLSAGILVFVMDSMAINRTKDIIDFEIKDSATTQEIAEQLEEKGLIDHALLFRVYSRVSKADGKWQKGAFTLSPDMGYATIVETLQTMTPRETVWVTIPEGYTVEEIANLLEEKGVCEKRDFYNAVIDGEYDYDFVKEIDEEEHAGRFYRLEGYLFPDTYEFYVGSAGETVVDRMLANFDRKLTPEIRKQIADRGWTIDQAIIFASLIEGEAANKEDMEKVSRVLHNRMESPQYPKLQLCSTQFYVQSLAPTVAGLELKNIAYDTYLRDGLPVGAINNPGMQALTAALNPSTDAHVMKCFYFATDFKTGITYFNKTFSEHQRDIRKYGISNNISFEN